MEGRRVRNRVNYYRLPPEGVEEAPDFVDSEKAPPKRAADDLDDATPPWKRPAVRKTVDRGFFQRRSSLAQQPVVSAPSHCLLSHANQVQDAGDSADGEQDGLQTMSEEQQIALAIQLSLDEQARVDDALLSDTDDDDDDDEKRLQLAISRSLDNDDSASWNGFSTDDEGDTTGPSEAETDIDGDADTSHEGEAIGPGEAESNDDDDDDGESPQPTITARRGKASWKGKVRIPEYHERVCRTLSLPSLHDTSATTADVLRDIGLVLPQLLPSDASIAWLLQRNPGPFPSQAVPQYDKSEAEDWPKVSPKLDQVWREQANGEPRPLGSLYLDRGMLVKPQGDMEDPIIIMTSYPSYDTSQL